MEHRLHHQEEVPDLPVQVDNLEHKDCLHNLLDLAVHQEVYPHQEDYLHHQEEGCNPLPQEVVLDLPVHRFEDSQVHKGYHHNLGLVLFHLEEEVVEHLNS